MSFKANTRHGEEEEEEEDWVNGEEGADAKLGPKPRLRPKADLDCS